MSIYETLKQELASFDLGIFNKAEQERRIAICQSCDKYSGNETHTCSVCGCNVGWRIMLMQNSCPEGKWIGQGIDKQEEI